LVVVVFVLLVLAETFLHQSNEWLGTVSKMTYIVGR